MIFHKDILKNSFKYKSYISSNEWKIKKMIRATLDNNWCIICHSTHNLICHHLSYKNLYKEKYYDLLTLCKYCHDRIHKISPPNDVPIFVKQNYSSYIFEVTFNDLINEMYPVPIINRKTTKEEELNIMIKLMWGDDTHK